MLMRRKWWIIISVFGISLTVLGVSLLLPKQYKSETLILVEPQKVPEDYVKATVTTDVTDRLQTISDEIMSRTRLSAIIQDLNLYPELRKEKSMDEIVAIMRKDITVDVLTKGNPDKHEVGAFKISFLGPTPQIAHDVTQHIADLFIQENLKERDQQAQGTSQFISAEAEKARKALEDQEAKIKQFNAAHLGALPQQEQTNLQLISQYQGLEQTNSEAIDRATQQRAYLQSMLAVTGKKEKALPPPPSETQLELQKKKQELAEARRKYTDSYPDVISLKEQVATLEQQVKAEPPPPKPVDTTPGPNQADQFQGQLVSLNQEIQSRTSHEAELEGQIRALQGRIEVGPEVQSEFADLNRDYEVLQKNYQSLIEKQSASGMAAELERHDESEQFRVLDPANLPEKPFSPNLPLINGAGLIGSIVLGLLLALLAELRDSEVHDALDVERYLGVPIISAIPRIPDVLEDGRGMPLQLPARAER